MRQKFFVLSFLAMLCEAMGQNTFNIRERYGFLACTLTSVVPTDSCLYLAGTIADTIPPYKTGSIFMKTDLQGNPLSIKSIKGVNRSYETWYPSLIPKGDGTFYNVGYTADSILVTFLTKYNADGDTVFTNKYLNPYYPTANFITPMGGLASLENGNFAILCWVATSNNPFGNDTNYYLIKTDSLGNKIWGKVFATSKWERPQSIVTTPGGSIVCGGIRTNQTTNVMDYTFQCHIFQVDSLGNHEWDYLSPISAGLRDAANDMLLLDDGSLIVASGIGHEQQHPSVNEVFLERYVFKLNPQHQIEWELTFPDTKLSWASRTANLIKLKDESGYILSGDYFNPIISFPYSNIMGWIAKISNDGDSVWTRRYDYVNDEPIGQRIYDTKETFDGGLIICGESRNYDDDANYPQQGWLLKLDEHGCLVPGCHLSDAVEEGQSQLDISLNIYPNPTSDYLNFYIRAPNPASGATIRIINAEGSLLKEFKTGSFGQTFIVPVWEWASGVYWVQVIREGEIITSEKFIKQ